MNSTDFSEILALLGEVEGKYVIVEDGKPAYVLMSIQEYKNMASNYSSRAIKDMSKEELVEKINKDIALWRSSQGEKEEELDDHFLSSETDSKANNEAQYYYEIEKDFE